MLDSNGFDLWADDYDKSVEISDTNDKYPFAGYKKLMNDVYSMVMKKCPVRVLDIGVGTGTLAYKLHEAGNNVIGVDFSGEMLNQARAKMPDSLLYQYDFTQGLPSELNNEKFDFIISTYALHHLDDTKKTGFIQSLFGYLKENGTIIIGDISFQTRNDLAHCKIVYADEWDENEFYFVFSELEEYLSGKCVLSYRQYSHCSGILIINTVCPKKGF